MSGAIVATTALVYAGLAAICAGYDRHRRQLWPGALRPDGARRKLITVAGWLMLVLSLALALREWSGGVGWVIWFGLLSAVTTLLVLQLAYGPRRIPLLATLAAGIALLLAAFTCYG